ncbi:MAG TPA: FtsX-like permease family protein [Chryseosolibacter sp.]|nr:FtsX-like permease family protein [Chryseosolibacter sp.]
MNLSYFISKKITGGQKGAFASSIHLIATLTIGIGLAASIVSFLIMKGFQETVKHKIYSFSGHLVLTKPSMNNSPEEPGMNYHIEMYTNKEKFPYIHHIQEYAHKAGLVKTEGEVVGLIIKGVGESFDRHAFAENMVEGEFIHFPDSGYSNEVVLSRTIANVLKASVGDEFIVHFFQTPPRFRKLKVAGIYETNLSEYYDSKIILADISLIQRLNDWPDSIAGGLEVMINTEAFSRSGLLDEHIEFETSPDDLGEQDFVQKSVSFVSAVWSFDYEAAAIEKAAQEIGIHNNYEQQVQLTEERYLQVFEWLHLISRQVNILLTIIVLVICVNMISIVLILVMERTQMIGLLKALGAKDSMIRSVFIYNGVNLVAKGLLLGNILGIGLCYIQHRFRVITLNPKDYYMSFVPISWHWDIILLLNLLTLIVVTAVLLIPTMAITRIDPIKAIRFD